MIIRTKIVATVGPATEDAGVIRRMAEAGCDVFRVNFSHGDESQRLGFLKTIRAVEAELDEPLAVMADLCGPKIRVGPIVGGSVLLGDGQELVIQREAIEGRADRIATTLKELVDQVAVGETILLDDGRIRLKVIDKAPPDEFRCEVVRGGVLSTGKGVNLPQTVLKLSALTEKDRADVAWIAQRDFDYVALSFVRSPADVHQLRALLVEAGADMRVVAKIEKPQALEHIEGIIDAADVVMVARGDLGVEMDLPAVPVAQKHIAHLCHRAGKCCIIATQMLESMTASPMPTRAEVSDVANAVLDLADAVMLSGETAVGKYPVAAVRMMNAIAEQTQAYHDQTYIPTPVASEPAQTEAAMARAVRQIIDTEHATAVAVFSVTGTAARMFAKTRLPVPILALSPDRAAARRMAMYYGVLPVRADAPAHTRDVLAMASRCLLERKVVAPGDRIVVVSGRPIDQPGSTNTIVIHTVK